MQLAFRSSTIQSAIMQCRWSCGRGRTNFAVFVSYDSNRVVEVTGTGNKAFRAGANNLKFEDEGSSQEAIEEIRRQRQSSL